VNSENTQIIHSPFDDSAKARQYRMGLISIDGAPDNNAIAVLAHVYAGLFYDNLCDYFEDMEHTENICSRLSEMRKSVSSQKLLLAICMQYDMMQKQLPEPIWWIVGNSALVELFAGEFLDCLRTLQKAV